MKLSKKLSKEYKEKGIRAYESICNGFACYLYDIEYGIDDYAIWSWGNEEILSKSKIKYKGDDAYFRIGNTWHDLHDFMRV